MRETKRTTRASHGSTRAFQNAQPKRSGMLPVKTKDRKIVARVHRNAGPDSPARQMAEALSSAPPSRPAGPWHREDYFPESTEWGPIPDFIPEEGEWPEAAREKQDRAFRLGYVKLLKFPRPPQPRWAQERPKFPWAEGEVAPLLWDLGACFPYFVLPGFELPLARVLLALNDDRVPKPVRARLKVHLRDILRGDALLYDTRPLPLPSRPVRITPQIRRAFHPLYRDLHALCRDPRDPRPTKERVCEVIRTHLSDWNQGIKREAELEKVLLVRPSKNMKPHEKAKNILSHVFGISNKYVRLLIYRQ